MRDTREFVFSDTVKCPDCDGRGYPINDRKDACPVCAGEGRCKVKEKK